MRIGRYNISMNRNDATNSTPNSIPNPKKLVYGKISTRPYGGGKRVLNWNAPEFDFKEIAKCLATESFFRRIVDKYTELIWRNGYKLQGDNPEVVDYLRRRFDEIALVTDTPTDTLFRDVSQQIVTYSNVFVEKVRDVDASSGSIRTTFDGRELDPVAGYYAIDATSIRIAKDPHGDILKYKQVIKGNESDGPEWDPADVIHVYKDREAGLTFGTPMVVPVLDDIKALRRIEENIEMLIFHNAIPLFIYLVGDEDNKPGQGDIAEAQSIVRSMPTEGMIVAPFYHDVKAVGSEGRALRCEGYLDHFKNRILAGLGASEVALGYSGSASRSTAETIERGMYNTVREFQKVLSRSVEAEIFRELLLEGNYEWNVDNKVELFFPEIDIDDMIKLENHVLNMYAGNLFTETEARARIGFEPIKDEQRPELYFNLVELIRALVQAVDEPFSTSVGPAALSQMLKKSLPTGRVRLARSTDMPSNQYGTKMSPGTTQNALIEPLDIASFDAAPLEDIPTKVEDDVTVVASRLLSTLHYDDYYNILRSQYNAATLDAVNMVRSRYVDGIVEDGELIIDSLSNYDKNTLKLIMGLTKEQMLKYSGEYIISALSAGILEACNQVGAEGVAIEYSYELDYLRRKNDEWLSRVLDSVKDSSEIIIRNTINKNEAVSNMISLFDSNVFRIRLGARNELQRSYNIGIFKGGMTLGYDKFTTTNIDFDDDGKCSVHTGSNYNIDRAVDLDSIPPGYMTHPLCTCTLKLIK